MKDDSGPAFPRTLTVNDGIDSYKQLATIGLTKREWSAGMMFNGILAGVPYGINAEEIEPATFKSWANCAVKCADALLAELNKERPDHDAK